MDEKMLDDLGRDVAHKCHWDGLDIMTAFQAALTDANFHHEAEIVGFMMKSLMEAETDIQFEIKVKGE